METCFFNGYQKQTSLKIYVFILRQQLLSLNITILTKTLQSPNELLIFDSSNTVFLIRNITDVNEVITIRLANIM